MASAADQNLAELDPSHEAEHVNSRKRKDPRHGSKEERRMGLTSPLEQRSRYLPFAFPLYFYHEWEMQKLLSC